MLIFFKKINGSLVHNEKLQNSEKIKYLESILENKILNEEDCTS